MEIGLNEILVAAGGILMTWVFNNAKLREGITDFILNRIGNSYNITTHNVQTTIKTLKFEAKLTDFDSDIKSELYQYYVNEFFKIMDNLISELLQNKKMNFHEIKKFIKETLYDGMIGLNEQIEREIILPPELNDKFSKFRNYLTLQYSYAIEHALHAQNKKILLIQVLDAIENNSRWFLFYCTEMFNNFNGKFDKLEFGDVFVNKINNLP